jgi:hypothetical protein
MERPETDPSGAADPPARRCASRGPLRLVDAGATAAPGGDDTHELSAAKIDRDDDPDDAAPDVLAW